ncbi:MAG: hypothetical protein ACYDHY_14935 [Acidiferrobacterales bacterium]
MSTCVYAGLFKDLVPEPECGPRCESEVRIYRDPHTGALSVTVDGQPADAALSALLIRAARSKNKLSDLSQDDSGDVRPA